MIQGIGLNDMVRIKELQDEIVELKRKLEFNQRRAVHFGNANQQLAAENWQLSCTVSSYQRHAMQWVLRNVEDLKCFMDKQIKEPQRSRARKKLAKKRKARRR